MCGSGRGEVRALGGILQSVKRDRRQLGEKEARRLPTSCLWPSCGQDVAGAFLSAVFRMSVSPDLYRQFLFGAFMLVAVCL